MPKDKKSPKKKKRRESPPDPKASPGTGAPAPAPAAPCKATKHHPFERSCTCLWNQAEPGKIPEAVVKKPARKSPKKKRAEKKAERAEWGFEESPVPPPAVKLHKDAGRPTKYTDMDLERIEAHARGGLTKREIAWANGISYDTLREYEKSFSEFSGAIHRGRRRRVEDAERSMHMMANGFTLPEEKVQYDAQTGEWMRTTVLKVVPPDVKAQHLILVKAETGSWSPRQGIDLKGQMTAKVVHIYGPEKKPEGEGAQ